MSKHWSDYGNTEEDGLTIMRLTAENEKLKRIVEVLEKSNNLYAEYGNDNPDSIYNFETARQAREEVERIRKGDEK